MVLLRSLFLYVAVAASVGLGEDGSESCSAATCATAAVPGGQPGADHLLLQLGRAAFKQPEKHQALAAADTVGEEVDGDTVILAESASDRCLNMRNVERRCSDDGCKVLATNMRHRSCSDYCSGMGYTCVGAWEEVHEDCREKYILTCDDASVPTSDLICQCAPDAQDQAPETRVAEGDDNMDAPSADDEDPNPAGDVVPVSTFFWNVHWECSMSAKGAKHSCKEAIGHRFVELAREANAEIVASIELSDSASEPASLVNFGLHDWTQVNGPCAAGHWNGDAAALAFAPTWRVEKSDGGCLRTDHDTRAFAVALAVPPQPVRGCPKLCVVAIHAPHTHINNGMDKVQQVCGEAAERCAIAMGDWNTPGHSVHRLWQSLIGGERPSAPQPDERSCCWPESHHYGVFDHLATNVRGAVHDDHTVHAYQLLEEHPTKQHRAVSARLLLPGGPLTA